MTEDTRIKMVIVMRKDLNMRKGKIASQAGHAAMLFLLGGDIQDPDSSVYDEKDYRRRFKLEVRLSWKMRGWLQSDYAKITVSVNSEAELLALIGQARAGGVEVWPVYDNGLTEFHGVKTLTCAAFGPDLASVLDPITGKLPLL